MSSHGVLETGDDTVLREPLVLCGHPAYSSLPKYLKG